MGFGGLICIVSLKYYTHLVSHKGWGWDSKINLTIPFSLSLQKKASSLDEKVSSASAPRSLQRKLFIHGFEGISFPEHFHCSPRVHVGWIFQFLVEQ